VNRIAAYWVGRHTFAVHSLYGDPQQRFSALLARCGAMWRVQFMAYVFTDFSASIIAECRRQAGL
jgi:hypothetical protein